MLQQGKRGRGATRTNAVAAGSVWETRMKMDQVRGGIKVFNGEQNTADPPDETAAPPPIPDLQANTTTQRKRRSWKQPELESDPIELRRALSELAKGPKSDEPTSPDDLFTEERTALDIGIGSGGGGQVAVELEKEMDLLEEEKKIDRIRDAPISSVEIGKVPPMEVEEDFKDSLQEQKNIMQSIVDLIMWKDISRSAFVFGVGLFLLLSSSYAMDLKFSLISSVSYLGLLYLAVIFLYESFLSREVENFPESDGRWVIGEEEAIWIIKMALPYMNELLLRLRCLFSGGPETTLKLAVILFALGKCGQQITVWTMAKLGFFALFTIPRLWASHSDRIRRYGMVLLDRARDSWLSCNHKKVVAVAVFALFWNFSSVSSRIWAVFMLLVALRYYHEHFLAVAGLASTGDKPDNVDVLELNGSHGSPSGRGRSLQRAVAGCGPPRRQKVAGPAGSGGGVGTKPKKRA